MTANDPDQAQAIWKAQNDKTQIARIKARPEELEGLVRSRENLNKAVYWTAMTVITLLAAGFLYNVFSTNQPWIRFGQAWALGAVAYVLGTQLHYRASSKEAHETCVRFLERQHEERARGYLRIRRQLWLIIPSIVASWIGKGLLISAQAAWPFFLVIAALILVWLAFGAAADKAMRDAKEIGVGLTGNGGLPDSA